MRDKLKKMLFLLTMCAMLGGTAVMAAQSGNVYDDAELLSEEEINELNTQITGMQERSGWNIYAVTTTDAGGRSSSAYADDFFDEHSPEQEDGVAVLIDMDNREITISTCGEAIRYLTDNRIDDILDDAYNDVSEGEYGNCLMTMLEGIDNAYDAGIPSGQYNYDVETGEVSVYRTITWLEASVALLLAAGAGAAVYAVVTGMYKLHFKTYKYDFRENSHVQLRVNDDRFVNETTTHRRIPRETSSSGRSSHSSGRSSTHRSSSGRSHGGGSRKF